jgi:DNA-binding response OmpR family regulator
MIMNKTLSGYRRILYADDNEDACLMLKVMLRLSGIEVECALSIREALQLAYNEQFDVYLLDTNFPDGCGFDLCRQLTALSPNTPVIFYSGCAYETDRVKGFAAGAVDYVTKPHFEQLPARIIHHTLYSPIAATTGLCRSPSTSIRTNTINSSSSAGSLNSFPSPFKRSAE